MDFLKKFESKLQTKKEIVTNLKIMSVCHDFLWFVMMIFIFIITKYEHDNVFFVIAASYLGLSILMLSLFYAILGILIRNNVIKAKNQIEDEFKEEEK